MNIIITSLLKSYFYVLSVILLIGTIPTSWAEQHEISISDIPIEIIIDVVHDFDQTFSFNASFFNTPYSSESEIHPVTNLFLIDPTGEIIFESSEKLLISHTPELEGKYVIRINISENQNMIYEWPSIILETTIETSQNFNSFGGRMINSALKTVDVRDYSLVESGNPAKEVTKIIYPQGRYPLDDSGNMNGSNMISIVKIPISALLDEYERNHSRQLEMDSLLINGKSVDAMTDNELIEQLQDVMTTLSDYPENFLADETIASDFMEDINLQVLVIAKIFDTLRERGYEFEAQVFTEKEHETLFSVESQSKEKLGINLKQLEIAQELIDEINSESVSDVESMAITGKNIDEMTDEELFDRFEKLLATDVDLTMQDMMDKIKDAEMTDALAEELEQRAGELWSEAEGVVEEIREIVKELEKRGYDVEAGVLTTDGPMSPIITISKPILTNDLMSPRMQVEQGIVSSDVICNDGLELVFKNSDNSPACVKPKTAEKLIARGWVIS